MRNLKGNTVKAGHKTLPAGVQMQPEHSAGPGSSRQGVSKKLCSKWPANAGTARIFGLVEKVLRSDTFLSHPLHLLASDAHAQPALSVQNASVASSNLYYTLPTSFNAFP